MVLTSFIEFTDKALVIFGQEVAYYALCILTGIVFAAILGVRESKKFGIASNLILDGVLICVPLAILGARLYYVFTSWADFKDPSAWQTFLNILGVTDEGLKLEGLAINGGIFVALIFVVIYCRKRRMNTLAIFDQLSVGLLIGQICGRWGNFFNQEAHGPAIVTKSWFHNLIPDFIMDRMYFVDKSISNTPQLWHPTFLYESMWNLVGLIAILVSRKKNKHQRIGDSICFYLIWYGLGRSLIIEPLRMDPLLFIDSVGPDVLFNRVNVVINLLLAVGGIVWLTLKHLKFKDPYYIQTQEEYKKTKIDGVICRIDDTLVTIDRLLENTYYYTAYDKLGVQLSDEELEKVVTVKPEEYFNNQEVVDYFYKYLEDNLDQMQVVIDVKELFKLLFKHDYHLAVVTKYTKEYALRVLKLLKINTYVSVIVDKDLSDDQIAKGFEAVSKANNILVISSLANDIMEANKRGAKSCLIYYGREIDLAMEQDPTYVISKARQLDNIIIE